MKPMVKAALAAVMAFLSAPALALESPAGLNSGDTAWMMVAAVLGLMMTVPGIALFYGGMVRRKNMLSISVQCFIICCIVTVTWMLVGYSLAFSGTNPYIGDLNLAMLTKLDMGGLRGTFPEPLYIIFQLGFAVVAAALIVGAVADRIRFAAILVFIAFWSVVVYAPIVHWIWGGGFLRDEGVLDYAGGTVVHISAGISGLVACLIVGPRKGYMQESMTPHNPLFSVIGVSLLWIGWFGFSGGSSLQAGSDAAAAMLVTQTSAAAGALAWMTLEWNMAKRPSVLGIVSGAVAGLVAVTPAAGFVSPAGGIAIGIVAGVSCCWAAGALKYKIGFDDTLDVFGIHGVGGLVGAILTGVFAIEAIGGAAGAVEGNLWQVWAQLEGVLVVAVWSACGTALILYGIKAFMPLRVSEKEEDDGLDYCQHLEVVGADG